MKEHKFNYLWTLKDANFTKDKEYFVIKLGGRLK